MSAVPSAPISPVEDAVWTGLRKGQLGIAYHIARLNEEIEEAVSPPSSELLATLALGSFVSGPEEAIVHEFGRRVGTVLSSLDFGNVGSADEGCFESPGLFGVLATRLVRPTANRGDPDAEMC